MLVVVAVVVAVEVVAVVVAAAAAAAAAEGRRTTNMIATKIMFAKTVDVTLVVKKLRSTKLNLRGLARIQMVEGLERCQCSCRLGSLWMYVTCRVFKHVGRFYQCCEFRFGLQLLSSGLEYSVISSAKLSLSICSDASKLVYRSLRTGRKLASASSF